MLAGVATRRHARTAEPVGAQVDREAKSTSRSAISRRFVRQTETALAELMARDLAGEDIKVLMLDGEHMAERCVVVALAITADGTKKPVGLWDGSTENKTVVRALLADLVERGLTFDDGLLVVLDGAKALVGGGAGGVRRQGPHPAMYFAQAAKRRRPPARQGQGRGWTPSWSRRSAIPIPSRGCATLNSLAAQLDKSYPGAAASLREGLEEMFTVARLGIDGRLAKTLTTSNPIESMISIARTTNRNVTRWRDGQMVLRWTAAGMLNAERSFRRIKGHKQMPQLVDALRRHAQPPTPAPNLSVPPPRVHHGSSPKIHADRDMLPSPSATFSQLCEPVIASERPASLRHHHAVIGHTGRIDGFARRRPPLGADPRQRHGLLQISSAAIGSITRIISAWCCGQTWWIAVISTSAPSTSSSPLFSRLLNPGNHPGLGGAVVDRPAQLRSGGVDRLHGCRRIGRGHSRAGQHCAGADNRRTKNRFLHHSNSLSFAPSARRSFPRNPLVLPRFMSAKPDACWIS